MNNNTEIKEYIHYVKRTQVYDIVAECRKMIEKYAKFGSSSSFGPIESNIQKIFGTDADILESFETIQDAVNLKKRKFLEKKNVEGVRFDILVDKDFNNKSAIIKRKIIKQIVNACSIRGYDLPYMAIPYTHKRSSYVSILFFDRVYYPEGKEIDVLATSDMYFSKETGLRVKETEECEKELRYTKGQVIRKKIINLSDKVRHWAGSKAQIKAYTDELKASIQSILNKYFTPKHKNLIKLIQNRVYKKQKGFYLVIDAHEKEYWWMIRKNMVINAYIRAINHIHRLNKEIAYDVGDFKRFIHKYQYMQSFNIETIEKQIRQEISSLKAKYLNVKLEELT